MLYYYGMSEQKSPIKLLLPRQYVEQARQAVRHAKRRIYIISLCFARGSATDGLIDDIIDASKRGIDVHVAADLLTFICDRTCTLPSSLAGAGMRQTDQLRSELEQAGAEFYWLGAKKIPYLLGRTHSKWTVVDDDVYAFGGVNLNQSGTTERTDYIFHMHDRQIADNLVSEQHLVESIELGKGHAVDREIDTQFGTMLLDGGKINRSIIYKHAVKLAKKAESVLLVSQYCPAGELARILKKKPATSIYFNPKGSAKDPVNNIMIGTRSTVKSLTTSYQRPRYLHAKFMIGTMPDGTKLAITGSHNFSTLGVRAGTREIALETGDPDIINQLEKFFTRYVS